MKRAVAVSDLDVALLRTVAAERSVLATGRRVGMSRDRVVYRLRRLARAFGGPVVESERGGRAHGGSRLTPLGDRIVRGGFDAVELDQARPVAPPPRSNLLRGTYRAGPSPSIDIGRGVRLRVAFAAEDGERVTAALDPEAVLVARGRFPSSARNVVPATVRSLPGARDARTIDARLDVAGTPWRVALTPEAVAALRLRPGTAVYLYVKATAVRRVGRARPPPTPGSRRS